MKENTRYVAKVFFQMVVMAAIFSVIYILLSLMIYGKVDLV